MVGFAYTKRAAMQLLHESVVQDTEIDSLGHMNVRYYMMRMESANQALLQRLDLPEQSLKQSMQRRIDTYSRFRREQFAGARLHAVGGLLTLGEGGMQSYVEIRNPDTEDVAATFIVTTALVDRKSRQVLPFPVPANTAIREQIDIPNHARPRSLTLGPVNIDVSIGELERLIPEIEGGGMMSGKRETTVEADDVDDDGWLSEGQELMFLPFAKMAVESGATQGPPVFTTADGRRVGWAVMETRNLVFGQPRLGDELAYFSADLKLEKKSRVSRRWALDKSTDRVLGISDTVGVCIDLNARRAIDWPQELREQIERYIQPQLT